MADEIENTTYTTEQLHAAIEKARLEEREKLRVSIDELNGRLTVISGEREQLTAKLTETAKAEQIAKEKLAALEGSKKADGGIDVEQAIDKALALYQQRVGGEFKTQLEELGSALAAERKLRSEAELRDMRTRLIAEHGGDATLIPDLVTGSNEAELRESIKRSMGIHAKVRGTANNASGSTTGAPPSLPAGGTADGSAGAGGGDTVQGFTAEQIKSMSAADWAKHRAAVKQAAAGRYANAAGDYLRRGA